jgi:serine/threonine protein kinase
MISPGTMLGGRYRLDERIAGGGMGDVWRGTDEVLGRTVAVKILLPALLEEAGFAERFRHEARTMATINHPGVVDVYDYGSDDATAFLVMEYIEGDALSRTLGRVGRLTPARTMALVAQAADALHAAHEKGIVHRDVKPGNLLVRPNGTLVLTDFGIARSAMVGQLTAAGSVLGTASYLAPEQAAGATATSLSDVYSLGVVAYQCLAGRRPFEGDNPLEIAMRHVRDTPPPLPGDIPPAARQIVERALAKDPASRWPSAAALAQVARRAATQLAAAGAPTSPPKSLAGAVGASPTSGAPVSPTSGGPGYPISGAPASAAMSPTSGPPTPTSGAGLGAPPTGPVAAGGTRIMAGGFPAGPAFAAGPAGPSGPTSGAPGSPAGPPRATSGSPAGAGQFARGTAGVPPPPAADTGYTQLGPGGYPVTGPVRGGNGPRDPKRTGLIAAAAALGVLLLLICVVGGVYYVQKSDKQPGGNPTTAPTTNATTTSPAAELVTIDCKGMKGKSATSVETALRKQGFTVKTRSVDKGGKNGDVADVPCSAPKGSEVTVDVTTGRGSSGGNGSGNPSPSATCPLGLCIPTGRQ